jgi:hypothetical protein
MLCRLEPPTCSSHLSSIGACVNPDLSSSNFRLRRPFKNMSARRQASTTSLSKYARASSPGPPNRSLDFCNAFWGLGDSGVDVLFARMRGAARTMDELRNFWKERCVFQRWYDAAFLLNLTRGRRSRKIMLSDWQSWQRRPWAKTRLGTWNRYFFSFLQRPSFIESYLSSRVRITMDAAEYC